MLHLPNTRWQAFVIHLGLSLLLFIFLSSIIYFLWYPGFLFEADGGWQGIRLIAGVDLVIGPLLTLIIYNKTKKSLRFDLSVIAALQLTCIIGGMTTVWYTKPLAVVYADGVFYTTNRVSYNTGGVNEVLPSEIPLLSGSQPVWLSIKLPLSSEEKTMVLATRGLFTSIALAHDLYQPYSKALSLLPNEGLNIEQATKKWGIQYPSITTPDILFYELSSRFNSGYIAVNSNTGEALRLLPKTLLQSETL